MPNFYAVEFTEKEGKETGEVEMYQADNIEAAVGKLLYTRRLADGNANLGFTGRVVYSRGMMYVVVRHPHMVTDGLNTN